jgi:hypothetical protein
LNGKTPLVEVVMTIYNPFNKPPMGDIFWEVILNSGISGDKTEAIKAILTIIG